MQNATIEIWCMGDLDFVILCKKLHPHVIKAYLRQPNILSLSLFESFWLHETTRAKPSGAFEEFGGRCRGQTEADVQLSSQSVFLFVGLCMGGCPEGRGTWNIKPCHGGSAQLWALSCSGSLPGVEVAAGVVKVLKRPLSLLLFTLLGRTAPFHVRAGGNVFVTFFWNHRCAEGKVGLCGLCLTVFIQNRE